MQTIVLFFSIVVVYACIYSSTIRTTARLLGADVVGILHGGRHVVGDLEAVPARVQVRLGLYM